MIKLDNITPNVVTSDLSDKIWLFYGEMATRKTSVACQFPKHLLLAWDIGYKFIDGAMAVPMQKWSDFKDVVRQLDQPANKERFNTIIIDTVGFAYQSCYQYMLTQMGVNDPGEVPYGGGWKKIRNEFEITLRSIVQKGYGLVMLAHSDEVEKEDKISKQKTLSVKIDIDKRPDLIIKGLADFVFFLHKENKVVDGVETPTVYAYSNLVQIDTKSRSRYFSEKFEFTYENLQAELRKAVERQYAEKHQPVPEATHINPYEEQPVDFDLLRNEVVELATALMEHGFDKEVQETLLNIFKGEKLSSLTENVKTIEGLQVCRETFIDLKTKARI